MGVFLFCLQRAWAAERLPHARGGVSPPPPYALLCPTVFPTPVGVFLRAQGSSLGGYRLPHARGGVSKGEQALDALRESSPRPWGCFKSAPMMDSQKSVFPTPVGVFPCAPLSYVLYPRLPHARGGVSMFRHFFIFGNASSPRPWGCFSRRHEGRASRHVFPTPVGVFLPEHIRFFLRGCLPHARGGVSNPLTGKRECAKSSPRPWGCFRS